MPIDAPLLRLNLLAAAGLPLAGWLAERLAPASGAATGLLAGLPLALAVVLLWFRPLARPAGRLPPALPGVIAGALLGAVGQPPAAAEPLAVAWLAQPVAALASVLAALAIATVGRALTRHGLVFSPRRWAVLGVVAAGALIILHVASGLFRTDAAAPAVLLGAMVRAAGDLLAVLALLPAALIWWLEPQPCPLRNGRQRVVLAGMFGLGLVAFAPLVLGAAGWLLLPPVAVWTAVRAGARAVGVGCTLLLLISASAAALGAGPFGQLSPLMQRIALLSLWWALLPPGLWLAGLAAPDAPRPALPLEGTPHAPD